MRTSTDNIIKLMFTNKLSKTGNLTMAVDETPNIDVKPNKKSKWGAVLVAENKKVRVSFLKQILKLLKLMLFFFFFLAEIKYFIPWTIFTSS